MALNSIKCDLNVISQNGAKIRFQSKLVMLYQ